MNSPSEDLSVTVLLPVTFTYNPDGLLWFIASAQSPEVRKRHCLNVARAVFSEKLDHLNGVVDEMLPSRTPDVIVSLHGKMPTR